MTEYQIKLIELLLNNHSSFKQQVLSVTTNTINTEVGGMTDYIVNTLEYLITLIVKDYEQTKELIDIVIKIE
jgi:hypothetical protein